MDQEPRTLIKRHNEYVREQVVHDLEALEEKLNVKRQVSERATAVTHTVVDKAKGTLGMNQEEVHGVSGFARKNAVPLAAVGLGGALLARNAKQMRDQQSNVHGTYVETSGYAAGPVVDNEPSTKDKLASKASGLKDSAASTVTDRASSVKDTVTGTASTVKGSVTDTASSVKGTVTEAGTMAAVRASEVKDTVVQKVPSRQQVVSTAKENAPLVGFAALALGALAGAFVPRTKMEESKLAPLQENVLETAKDAVESNVDKAKGALQAGVETVKDEVGGDSSEEEPKTTTKNRITGAGATSSNGMYTTPAGSL